MTKLTKETRPLISFIITDYNIPPQLLQECVGSILALDIRSDEREILLIDDGSKEPVEYVSDDVRIIRKENGGTGSARNLGLDNARGRFVQLVDGDDCLIAERYNRLIDFTRGNDFDCLMFDFTHSMETNVVSASFNFSDGATFLNNHNMRSVSCNLLISHELVGGYRFDSSKYQEDERFVFDVIIKSSRFVSTDIKAYYYRVLPDSKSNKKDPGTVRLRIDDLFGIIAELKDTDFHDRLSNSARSRRVAQLSMDYLYRVIVELSSTEDKRQCVQALRSAGLYPLPVRFYTLKYFVFSLLTRIVFINLLGKRKKIFPIFSIFPIFPKI